MPETDAATIAGIIAILLLALSWHEAAHAWVADKLGDPTARSLGRVSLNPLRHLDPFLSFVLPVLMFMTVGFAFGGGKPVPINPAYFKHKARDFMLVALAGPISNLVLGIAFGLVLVGVVWAGGIPGGVVPNPYGADVTYSPDLNSKPETFLHVFLLMGVVLNVLLAVFNLIPIPPLDGSRVVGWLLPRPLQASWYRLDRIGLILVLVFIFGLDGFQYISMAMTAVLLAFNEVFIWLVDLGPLT